ncbi:hypothetical protein [Carnobacterium maltaromaticum]|uniref:hypothetical protein n=1 Tax=Carnobacterium maltaromaticum TaxID=2751 RepID=UPI0039BDDB06
MNRKEEKAVIQEFFKQLFTHEIEIKLDKKEPTIEEEMTTEEQREFKRKVTRFYQS